MRGVMYYNRGTGCLLRLACSVSSLRNFWLGKVAVVAEGALPDWFVDVASRSGVSVVQAPESAEPVLVSKSSVWRHSPFDSTLFLDADTIVLGGVEEAFLAAEATGLAVTRFNDWHTHRGRMRARVEAWRQVAPAEVEAAFAYGWAVNTGVMAWTAAAKGQNKAMEDYEAMTRRGKGAAGVSRKTLDEIAMQLVVTRHPHTLLGKEWNVSPVYGSEAGAKIVHYHGNKHCRTGAMFDIWKQRYQWVVAENPNRRNALLHGHGDSSVARWQAETRGVMPDMTIVTAVNPAYAERCKRNLALWMATPGLAGNKFLVFVNGFTRAAHRAFLNHPNIKVVRWEYPHPGASTRETMLAAFVTGAATHVKTDYWMKLDCDTAPAKKEWKWPDYRSATVTSHRWGYTKTKGDPGALVHWFNRLDQVFSPSAPFFKRTFDPKADFQVGHRPGNKDGLPMRFASFAHIEKTAFTRRIAAAVAAAGGRLPIQSHDTTAWYCASLWGEKVNLVNMKEWFKP